MSFILNVLIQQLMRSKRKKGEKMGNEKDVNLIKVYYDDGSVKEITSDGAVEFVGDRAMMDMLSFSQADIFLLTFGMMTAIDQLGLSEEFEKYTESIGKIMD